MEWVRIINAKSAGSLKLDLTFNDGVNGIYDFKPVADGGVLRNLQDSVFFEKFEIVRKGRALEWPGGIDFCADSLYEEIMQLKYSNQPLFQSAANK